MRMQAKSRKVRIQRVEGTKVESALYDRAAHKKAAEEAGMLMNSLRAPMRVGFPDDQARYVEARCSEVVLEALQPFCGLKWDRIADVTLGLGAGFSGMGEVCGAVSGAVIAFGLDIASRYREQAVLRVLISKATQEFMKAIKDEFGGVRCADITRHDISGLLIPGDKNYRSFIEDKDAVKKCDSIQRFAIMYPLPFELDDFRDDPTVWQKPYV
jgi:C_GCAxxG_C_C family probable redox protein